MSGIKNPLKIIKKILFYKVTKRQKLVLMSGFLTIVLVATQIVPESSRYQMIGFLAISTIGLAVFSLWGELSGVKYFLLLLLPVYFVVGASLFYFLLPVRWLTRLPFAAAFGISVYLLMLTSNIYNVAAIRTIALLRAANAVGLLFSLLSTFFLSNVLFSLHFPLYLVFPGVGLIVMPLYLVGLWANELEDFISRKVFLYTLIFTLMSCEVAVALSFWPIAPINAALVMATIMYVLLALSQFHFQERLKPRLVYEYLSVAVLVSVIIMVVTRWGA